MTPLWLALDLPRLPLEAHTASPAPEASASVAASGAGIASRPRVAVEHGRIVVADDAALTTGLAPGMGLAAARAIAPTLEARPRDRQRETAALAALACWAGGFTPRIVLAPPAALLLEIGGCLRYFGGADAILAAVVQGCAGQGFRARAAVAPTPQGALWLAHAAATLAATAPPGEPAASLADAVRLAAALDRLPLVALDLPAGAQQRLAGFGARTLGDARRLPAAALARRIGAETLARIARAYGELPDPRTDFVFPDRFGHMLELPAPVEQAGALLFAARRLVAALAGWLAARQYGLAVCTLRLEHRRREATVVELRFASATRDEARIVRVLREHLERLPLPAPVESLLLAADAVAPLAGASGSLFDGGRAGGEGMAALIERLRARLGEARVHGLAVVADHRPECATRHAPQGEGSAIAEFAAAPRPFWLLVAPEPLRERAGRPWRNGPLQLLAGPERIESGWWGQGEATPGDARRDYFVALTADTRWAWIFRELRAPGGWFLHGWFA